MYVCPDSVPQAQPAPNALQRNTQGSQQSFIQVHLCAQRYLQDVLKSLLCKEAKLCDSNYVGKRDKSIFCDYQ